MILVDEGEGLVVSLALNSYSWVGAFPEPALYRPYGILHVNPASGPYNGYSEVLISGKGFAPDIAEHARCRFGVEASHAIVEAEVLDYNRLVCRAPEDYPLPEGADELFSVPLSIAFGEEEFKPWTLGVQRYRFYNQPRIEFAVPDEVKIGKFREIYLIAYEDTKFFERKCPHNLLCAFSCVCLTTRGSPCLTGLMCSAADGPQR